MPFQQVFVYLRLDDRSNIILCMDHTTPYQDTRERILSTGEALILGRGFSAVGLSEILNQAAVPKGSFYHYFQSKEGFGVALLVRYFDAYEARLAALFQDQTHSARERLLAYFDGWRQLHAASDCHRSCLAVKLAAEVSDLSEPMREALHKGMTRIVEQLAGAVRACQADGTLSADANAEQLAQSLYAMWIGASLLAKVDRSLLPIELAFSQTEQMLQAI